MSSIANVLRRIENAGIISPGTTATAWKDGTTPESGGGETTTKPPSGKPRHQLEEQQQQQQRQRPPRKPAAGIDGVNRRRASAAARVVAEQHRRAEEVRHADDQRQRQLHHLDRGKPAAAGGGAHGPVPPEGFEGEDLADYYLQLTPRGTESDPHAAAGLAEHATRQMRTTSAPPRMSPGPRTRQGRLLRPVETVVAARREKASLAVSSLSYSM